MSQILKYCKVGTTFRYGTSHYIIIEKYSYIVRCQDTYGTKRAFGEKEKVNPVEMVRFLELEENAIGGEELKFK